MLSRLKHFFPFFQVWYYMVLVKRNEVCHLLLYQSYFLFESKFLHIFLRYYSFVADRSYKPKIEYNKLSMNDSLQSPQLHIAFFDILIYYALVCIPKAIWETKVWAVKPTVYLLPVLTSLPLFSFVQINVPTSTSDKRQGVTCGKRQYCAWRRLISCFKLEIFLLILVRCFDESIRYEL